jgi:opacity protein-like surface antigen
MQIRAFIIMTLIIAVFMANPIYARDNKGEFGAGLQLGYFFSEFGDHQGANYYMESTDDMIYGLNLTAGFTNHFFAQLIAEYNISNLDYNIKSGYKDKKTNYYIDYDAKADMTNIPISLNIGYSLLKEGKLDPFVSLGPTWFSVKADAVTAEGKLYQVGDLFEDLKYVENRRFDIDQLDDNAFGLNIGAGLNYFAWKHAALCFDARYYWGEADFGLDNKIDVGGFRTSIGFKFVFGGIK